VHYPGDVLGGAALGILIGWLISLIFKRYFNFGVKKISPANITL
jgi:membrane-associated phospholipid phosphatase